MNFKVSKCDTVCLFIPPRVSKYVLLRVLSCLVLSLALALWLDESTAYIVSSVYFGYGDELCAFLESEAPVLKVQFSGASPGPNT